MMPGGKGQGGGGGQGSNGGQGGGIGRGGGQGQGGGQGRGGGIFYTSHNSFSSSAVIYNNILYMNRTGAQNGGGGICCYNNAIPRIVNNTIADNAADNGGAIWCMGADLYSPHPKVANSILWGNRAINGPQVWLGNGPAHSSLSIRHSDVMQGKDAIYVGSGSTLNWGPGMIDSTPLFVDASAGDLHLTFASPCKDTGDNSAAAALVDFEGDPRIAYGTVDMGAD